MRTLTLLKMIAAFMAASAVAADPVNTVDELTSAVANAKAGDLIELAEGTFRLSRTLDVPGGITLRGAGMDRTVVTHADSWKPSTESLPASITTS